MLFAWDTDWPWGLSFCLGIILEPLLSVPQDVDLIPLALPLKELKI